MSEVIKPILLDETGQAINETLNKIYGKMVGSDVSDATAVAGDILSGKTAYIATGKTNGSMPNNGAVAATIDGLTTTSYTIPQGYHSGTGTVSLTNAIETALSAI